MRRTVAGLAALSVLALAAGCTSEDMGTASKGVAPADTDDEPEAGSEGGPGGEESGDPSDDDPDDPDDPDNDDDDDDDDPGDDDDDDPGDDDDDDDPGDDDDDDATGDTGFAPIDCDPYAQDCPAGHKCLGSIEGALPQCFPVVDDPGAPGDACSMDLDGADDCDASSMCSFMDASGVGECIPMCGGSVDEPDCGNGTSCTISADGIPNLCLTECDPLTVDCGDGDTCMPNLHETFWCVPVVGGAGYGEACEFENECISGLACVDAVHAEECDGVRCCTALCDVSDADPDAGCPDVALGQGCAAMFPDAEGDAYGHVGLCTFDL